MLRVNQNVKIYQKQHFIKLFQPIPFFNLSSQMGLGRAVLWIILCRVLCCCCVCYYGAMSVTVNHVVDVLTQWAPESLACDWDNVGLHIGSLNQEVCRVLVALEVDAHVLSLVESGVYDLVVTHHPLIFTPMTQVNLDEDMGRIVHSLSSNTSLWAMHTNLDAPGGVTDCLIEQFWPNTRVHEYL